MNTAGRRIGRAGTISRVIVALGLLYLALTHGGLSWRLTWHDVVLGLIAFPTVMILIGLAADRLAGRAIHFTGPLGVAINTAVIVALLTNRCTAGAAELFYGITLLAAAWGGQPGCEVTVLSNLILGRDDQIGCPAFTPIDALEARHGPGQRPVKHPRQKEPERPAPPQREATHMATGHEQTPLRRDHQREDAHGRNPLLHLSTCLTAGAMVILAILAIHWLT